MLKQDQIIRLLKNEVQNFNILPEQVKTYLKDKKTEQLNDIQKGKPTSNNKAYNNFIVIFLTIIFTVINYDTIFLSGIEQTTSIDQFVPKQLSSKVQYVIQHTIIKYTILFPIKIQDCEPISKYFFPNSICSNKFVQLKAKLVYNIGYLPDWNTLQYDFSTNTYTGDMGPLQIISINSQDQIQLQHRGFFNAWTIDQYQKKSKDKINFAKNHFAQTKVNKYIQTITSDNSSLSMLEQNIKNALTNIAKDRTANKKFLAERLLHFVTQGLDKILIALNIPTFLAEQKPKKQDPFDESSFTQVLNQDIFVTDQEASKVFQISRPLQNMQKTSDPQKQEQLVKKVAQYDAQTAHKDLDRLLAKTK